ncbi:GNAT family N-acetyltransferase [Enhygromyxa salina]|uniref:Ribosomal-protein-alanine N-acetyltransferase n=1 Tax=Enhygromyxa salina TaxID=215803 RepID=A0A2S9YME8_9BACT|nr:GNAT family N-acetyltransferase [Enhygromyxa salina]PRQ06216.1 ribosomal-protein-alanine N-acetyltransferase [Enhygromyxa salina]
MAKALAVEIRTLRDSELPQVHDLVLDASAIYPTPIRPSVAQLGAMLERRGVDWASSFGAFSEGRLIGATITAVDEWPALHMGAYAIVSAVRKGWQGKGVLSALFEWLSLALDRREVTQMQLEVRIDDARARRAYERLGFDAERHLFCFELPRLSRPQRFQERLGFDVYEGDAAAAAEAERGELWTSFWSLTPAWTGSTWTVKRSKSRVVFEARWQQEVCGYAVVVPETAELVQIAVAPEHRRKGVATELIRACHQRVHGPALHVLNVDDGADRGVTIGCLRSLGATMSAVQLEMVLHRVS